MITIKTVDNNNAELKIEKNTPHTTLLLGLEMLIEATIKETNMSIDDVLEDIKTIYIRDNGGENENIK